MKINALGWPWTAVTHSTAHIMCLSELIMEIWKKIYLYYQPQQCRPWTLLSEGYKVHADIHGGVVWDFEPLRHGTPSGGSVAKGLKRLSDGQNRRFLVISVAIFSEPLELKTILCSVMKCLIGFPVTLTCLTLNNREMPLYAKICFHRRFD